MSDSWIPKLTPDQLMSPAEAKEREREDRAQEARRLWDAIVPRTIEWDPSRPLAPGMMRLRDWEPTVSVLLFGPDGQRSAGVLFRRALGRAVATGEFWRTVSGAFWTTAADITRLAKGHPLGASEEPTARQARHCRLLILEELAAGRGDAVRSVLEGRVRMGKVSIITSSAGRQTLEKRYGEGIIEVLSPPSRPPRVVNLAKDGSRG